MDALREVKRTFPQMLASIGTVVAPYQVKQALDAEAEFAVAPGMNIRIVETALMVGLPFAPGVCTPSDIERAIAVSDAARKTPTPTQ